MFHNFSLYPGGAFMLCESVGEFDENVPLPTPKETPAAVMTPMVEQGDDPVIKTIAKLSAVYERTVEPMLTMDQTGDIEDTQGTLHKLETISVGISDIANNVRKSIGTLSGMVRVFTSANADYAEESFASHLGLFMQSTAIVKREGVASTEYSYDTLPIYERMWKMNNLISALHSTPEVLDDIIYASTFDALIAGDSERTFDIFESTIDMLQCIYTNPERLARLQTRVTNKIEFDNLVKSRAWAEESNCQQADNDKMCRQYACTLSTSLRKVSQSCYDMQCRLVDGTLTSGEFSTTVRRLLSRCINLFAVGTLVALTLATELRAIIAKKQEVDEYTKLLLSILKTV